MARQTRNHQAFRFPPRQYHFDYAHFDEGIQELVECRGIGRGNNDVDVPRRRRHAAIAPHNLVLDARNTIGHLMKNSIVFVDFLARDSFQDVFIVLEAHFLGCI